MIYFKDNELLKEIILSKENNELTKYGKELLFDLTDIVMDRHDIFSNEEERYKRYLSAKLHLNRWWKKYDCNKDIKPHAYFVQIIKRGMLDKNYDSNSKIYLRKMKLNKIIKKITEI